MLDDVETVRWSAEVQPTGNTDGAVPRALRGLAEATTATGEAALSRLLFAVGNDHCGSYRPVVLAVVPFLGEILRDGGDTARARTLDALVDLTGSFGPEPGFEHVTTPDGEGLVKELLREKVLALVPEIERCRITAATLEEVALATYLLEQLALEPW